MGVGAVTKALAIEGPACVDVGSGGSTTGGWAARGACGTGGRGGGL
jgi:hypothetical protein